MNLKGLISIGGHSGLFKVVSQGKFGLIVESLIDGKRMPAYSSQKVSALQDISIFTTGDDVSLSDVMDKIREKEKSGPALDSKASNEELKKYFAEILPDFDSERVYVSDIKKVISWYNLLQSKDMLDMPEEEEGTEKEGESKEKTKKAPAKKETKSKKAKEAEENKPAKKTAKVKEEQPTAKGKTNDEVPHKSSKAGGAKSTTKKGKTGV